MANGVARVVNGESGSEAGFGRSAAGRENKTNFLLTFCGGNQISGKSRSRFFSTPNFKCLKLFSFSKKNR